jgi:hypothetical protein
MTMGKGSRQPMPAVRKPQAKVLATWFATILARRGRGNCRPRSRSGDAGARTMARQVRRGFAWPDCQQRVITVARVPCAAVLSAQEASCIPQSGQQTCGLGPCCTGCPSRAARGLQVSTLAVVDGTRRGACTRAVAQTPPGDDATGSPQAKEATSVDGYRQPRRAQRHRFPPQVTSPGVDGSWAQQPSLDEAVRLALHPMTTLRGDADCRLLSPGPHPQRRGARRQSAGNSHVQALRRVASLGTRAAAAHRHLSTALVWHVTRKRTLRLVVVVHRHAPAPPRSLVLASTELALDGRKVVEWDGARFQRAFVCRASQQCTGLRDCQGRAAAALDGHGHAALAPRNLARPAQLFEPTGEAPQVCAMASGKPRPFHERWRAVFLEK